MLIGNKEHPVRLSFVKLAEPDYKKDGQGNPTGTDKFYSVQIVIDKRHTDVVKAVDTAIMEAMAEGVKKGLFTKAAMNNPAFKRCLRDGDQKAAEKEDGSQDYLKGCMFMNASCSERFKPTVKDRFGNNMEGPDGDRTKIKEEVYSGCYAVVSANFFPFKHGNGGIGLGLNHVMKRGEGERLDGMESADSAFKDLVDDPMDDMESDSGDAASGDLQ